MLTAVELKGTVGDESMIAIILSQIFFLQVGLRFFMSVLLLRLGIFWGWN